MANLTEVLIFAAGAGAMILAACILAVTRLTGNNCCL